MCVGLVCVFFFFIFRYEVTKYFCCCCSEVCYLSKATGHYAERHRCATERVEGVTGLDILYDDFHNRSMESMQASDFRKSCGLTYKCPDGIEDCQTRCVTCGKIFAVCVFLLIWFVGVFCVYLVCVCTRTGEHMFEGVCVHAVSFFNNISVFQNLICLRNNFHTVQEDKMSAFRQTSDMALFNQNFYLLLEK